jgi:hypothetical protein
MKKLVQSLIGILVALSLFQALPTVVAAQSNATTVGTIELVATFESISVYSSFSGDDNGNNEAHLEYRINGESTWEEAPIPMVVDRRVEVPIPNTGWGSYPDPVYMTNPYYNQWRGNILFLEPNTQYEVQVTYSDPDGIDGPSSHISAVKTWDEDPPSVGAELHVSPSGSDSNPGTITAPFATPGKAATVAQPGDTIYLHGGTYSGTYYITCSGQEDNYIKWVPYGDGDAIFTGYRAFAISGNYNRVIGMLSSPDGSIRFNTGGSKVVHITGDFNRIEDCLFDSASIQIGPGDGSDYIAGRGNVISGNQGNMRIDLLYCAGNLVIRRNNMRAGTSGGAGDGIYGAPNFPGYYPQIDIDWGGERKDSDIYENEIWDTGDDICELEGAGINSRVWGNRFHFGRKGRGGVGMGLGPAAVIGPKYVFRNLIYDYDGPAFKLGKLSTGELFVYHNTIYSRTYLWEGDGSLNQNGYGFQPTAGEPFFNSHFRNNVVVVYQSHTEQHNQYQFPDLITYMGLQEPLNDWDYNLYYSHTPTHWYQRFWVAGDSGFTVFRSFADWQAASGQEAHGLFADPLLVDPYPTVGDFQLTEGSPCIDAGVVLPGFNDDDSPWPFQGSDPDIGAYESGLTLPNRSPVLYHIGDKSTHEEELLEFTISASDPDGDPLTYSASDLPPGASFDPDTRTFSWTPSSGQAGTYPDVHFEVSDGELTDSENITVTVTSGNRPPILESIGDKSVDEEELLEFTISATDPDDDYPLIYSADNLPTGATFDPDTQLFSWTPETGQSGTYPDVHFQVSDSELTDEEYITIIVSIPTQPPSLPLRVNTGGDVYIDNSNNTWQADQAYTSGIWGFYGDDNTVDRGTGHAISGTDDDRIYQTERYGLSGYRFDLDDGTYDVNLHFAETYHSDPGDRIFDVSIEGQLVLDNLDICSEVGSDAALIKAFSNVSVTDGQLNIDFTASVEQPLINGIEIFSAGTTPNNPPVLNPIGNKTVEEGQLLQFTVSASDPDGDSLTYSASNLPSGASFEPGTQTFSWTPGTGQAGTYTDVHFEVDDGDLPDSEDIAIIVNEAGASGGGGGGGGGGSDTSPPRFSDITVSDISKTSATISWSTHEKSDSQVEYWASPRQYSPLDETLVRSHVVQLTDLNPATTYSYRVMSHDAAGNLAVSDEYTLTTPGTPAAFTVSGMEINPTEVNAGETVIVSIMVTNNGDAAGDYKVVLKINGNIAATKDITGLPGGATQEVIFNAARNAAGSYTVEVNGATGSFTVTGASAAEAILFKVAPAYNSETGQLARARIDYEVESPGEPMADVRLVLKVGLDGGPVEELSLFTASQLEMGRSGSLDYIPPQGWENGTYTFQAELYANGELCASTAVAEMEVSADTAVAVVRWATLGAIIGIMLIVIVATVVMILRRRRDMLGA